MARTTARRLAPAIAVLIATLAAAAADGQVAANSVAVTITTSGDGAVSASTGGPACRGVCTLALPRGTAVTLTAAADPGGHLDSWGGACIGTAAGCGLVANGALAVTAVFAPGAARLPPLVRLEVIRSGGGRVTSDPPGTIDCGATCSVPLSQGADVTLNALADPGSTFAGWSGACAGTGACSLTMTAGQQVTAVFRDGAGTAGSSLVTLVNRNPAVPALPGLGGTVQITTPLGTSPCTAGTCTFTVANGSTVTLDASGSFPTWSSGCFGSGVHCQLVVSAPITVTVSFPLATEAATAYGVNVSRTPGGKITSVPPGVTCGDSGGCAAAFAEKTNVQLTAVADPNFVFLGWGGDCSGTAACSVVTDATRSVVATFGASRVSVAVARSGKGSGTVSSGGGEIACGSTCSASFDRGSAVTLQAAARAGSVFGGWSGACRGAGVCTFTPTGNATVGARFDRCALAVPPTLDATAGSRPRHVTVGLRIGGPALVTVALLRQGKRVVPSASRKVTAGRTAFRLGLPASAPRGAYTVQVSVKDACGGQRALRRQVRA